jgi:hypothetical protein
VDGRRTGDQANSRQAENVKDRLLVDAVDAVELSGVAPVFLVLFFGCYFLSLPSVLLVALPVLSFLFVAFFLFPPGVQSRSGEAAMDGRVDWGVW